MSPMYDAGMDRHYFIDELAALKDGRMVIPVRWLENESGEVHFDAWEVKVNEQTASHLRMAIISHRPYKSSPRAYQRFLIRRW